METLGDRIIVKDLPNKENALSGGKPLTKGTIKFVGHLVDENIFQVGGVVSYSDTTGSKFFFDGEELRSITKPQESIIFVE